jgi:ADP-heptose:LPS heptosyltransferase
MENGFQIGLLVKGPAEKEVAEALLSDYEFSCATLAEFGEGKVDQALETIRWIRGQAAKYAFAQFGVSSPLFSVLTLLGGVKYRIGWKGRFSWLNFKSLVPSGRHKVVETARFLNILKIDYDLEDLRFGGGGPCAAGDRTRVVLAPGSGQLESHKRWPKEQYCELARRLVRETGTYVEVLCGPDENELCESIVKTAGSEKVTSFGKTLSLRKIIERLRTVNIIVSNCNGIAHLAAMVGIPIVGIYGPTDAAVTGPFTKRLTTVSLEMGCAPCYRKGYVTGCGNPVCMTNIDVEKVYSVVCRELTRQKCH